MTDGTVRGFRHTADENVTAARTGLAGVSGLLRGAPGFTIQEQIERLEQAEDLVSDAKEALEAAEEALGAALDVVSERSEDESLEAGDEGDTKEALKAAVADLLARIEAL